jgi:hypothetical protein
MSMRMLSFATAGLVTALFVAVTTMPAKAQSGNAEQACTPDVMRLCQDFVPDRDRIVGCLKAKRRQLSSECRAVFSGTGKGKGKRRHRRG